jgi:eukaryotic-like serine/threonine-protein kinase
METPGWRIEVSSLDRSTFEQCAVASGLLTQQQLDDARSRVRWSEGDEPDQNAPPSERQLADRLVEMGLLNVWQAKQLLDGRTKFNLGPYQILDSIGQGGMGQVFKAKHDKIDRIVAVKVLPRDKSTPEAVDSFTREIRALASLDHPKLVSALDAGQDGNVHYLVTEYVPGTNLRKLVRHDGPLGMAAAASIISQVAEGLEYAHAKGIVHRDVKPGNVLVSPDGMAKLSDLGLAGSLSGEPEADPRLGKIVGTADYLSPDHVRDPWNPTPAWDIYSLGCTLYYAVTGKVPFPGGTTSEKARAHCELRPLDPRRLNSRLNGEFVEVLADMMAKEPTERIRSAREVIERLAPFLSIPDPPPPVAPPPIVSQPAGMPQLRALRRLTPGGSLADTKTDFAGIFADAVDEDSSSSEVVAAFVPAGPGETENQQPVKIPMVWHDDLMVVLWPLTIFVLAPLALIGALVLLWSVVQKLL